MTFEELKEILVSLKPSEEIKKKEKEIFDFIPELEKSKGFNQNNPWHVYDVYEHILHVVDNVDDMFELRLAALFHDIGKPYVYKEDANGIGHFYNHWLVSEEIFSKFATRESMNEKTIKRISKLIFYHDKSLNKLDDHELACVLSQFSQEELIMLYKLKRADLMAQNEEYHYLLSDYDKEEKELLKKY